MEATVRPIMITEGMSTRRTPNLSMMNPRQGEAMTTAKLVMVIANDSSPRLQPNSSSRGLTKTPKANMVNMA